MDALCGVSSGDHTRGTCVLPADHADLWHFAPKTGHWSYVGDPAEAQEAYARLVRLGVLDNDGSVAVD